MKKDVFAMTSGEGKRWRKGGVLEERALTREKRSSPKGEATNEGGHTRSPAEEVHFVYLGLGEGTISKVSITVCTQGDKKEGCSSSPQVGVPGRVPSLREGNVKSAETKGGKAFTEHRLARRATPHTIAPGDDRHIL